MHPARCLLLPGWQGSHNDHWQSHWARLPAFSMVEQADWWWPRRGDWMAQLEQALLADARPAVLVAHGLGCHLVARWAGHSSHTQRVTAALLVAPPDLRRPMLAPQLQAWAPPLRQALPFPSTVVASDEDPWCSAAHAQQLATSWGSQWQPLRGAGHGHCQSGFGAWPQGLHLVAQLCQRGGVATSPAKATDQANTAHHAPPAH